MKILLVHNHYQVRGGEDFGVGFLADVLVRHGHDVRFLTRDSGTLKALTLGRCALLPFTALFSLSAYQEMKRCLEKFRPDVVHVHNIFPLLSPSVYYAASDMGVPVVQTLHNYRLFCVNGLFLRNGSPCEECLAGNPLHGIVGRCYRQSVSASASAALTLFAHKCAGTWRRKVSAFIALSQFSKAKFVQGGLPEEKIEILPNFLDVSTCSFQNKPGRNLVYLGRLSQEKGILTLMKGYKVFSRRFPDVTLHVLGDGPLRQQVEVFASTLGDHRVVMHGHVEGDEKWGLLGNAAALIFPSECYENCPYTVLESLAAGTPVVASRLGGTVELIEEGKTGAFFESGRAEGLAEVLGRLFEDPNTLQSMRFPARRSAEERFDVSLALGHLLEFYQRVRARGEKRVEFRG